MSDPIWMDVWLLMEDSLVFFLGDELVTTERLLRNGRIGGEGVESPVCLTLGLKWFANAPLPDVEGEDGLLDRLAEEEPNAALRAAKLKGMVICKLLYWQYRL